MTTYAEPRLPAGPSVRRVPFALRTVGVEEEMLLVDPVDGRPVARSVEVLHGLASEVATPRGAGLEAEFQQEMVESHTGPVRSMEELEHQVRQMRRLTAAAAAETGCAVVAVGAAPFGVEATPSESRRYAWMQERYQLTARQHLTCAQHVHVAVGSAEEGVAVLDRIRVWLPALLALGANSPFWGGQDTGFASYRSQLVSRWPSAGPTDVFGSVVAYRSRVRELVGSGVILDEGMIYFDARLSHHCPTVEVRVADVSPRPADTVLLAALTRALVETAAREWSAGMPSPAHGSGILRAATWQAGRDGLGGTLLHPRSMRPQPAWDVVTDLVNHVGRALEDSGDLALVTDGLGSLHHSGNGAQWQRERLSRTGRIEDVISRAILRFNE